MAVCFLPNPSKSPQSIVHTVTRRREVQYIFKSWDSGKKGASLQRTGGPVAFASILRYSMPSLLSPLEMPMAFPQAVTVVGADSAAGETVYPSRQYLAASTLSEASTSKSIDKKQNCQGVLKNSLVRHGKTVQLQHLTTEVHG